MKDQKEVVKKVIDYIERNLEKEINLDNISKNIASILSIFKVAKPFESDGSSNFTYSLIVTIN